jgi:hypothetical protein
MSTPLKKKNKNQLELFPVKPPFKPGKLYKWQDMMLGYGKVSVQRTALRAFRVLSKDWNSLSCCSPERAL